MPMAWEHRTLVARGTESVFWEHTTGARVYESKFWVSQGRSHTWKAQRVDDVPDGDDDGYLYQTREEAMEAALKGTD